MRAIAACLALLTAAAAAPVDVRWPQGVLRGFPDLSDEQGKKIADGRLSQWLEGERLHVRLEWRFPGGRTIREEAELTQGKQLAQTRWSWEERIAGEVRRAYSVDLATGQAHYRKDGSDRRDEKEATLTVHRGKTFAGIGVAFAAAQLLGAMREGGKYELEAVAWMPSPRVSGISLSFGQQQTLRRAGKSLAVDDVVVHPEVPGIVAKIAGIHDVHLYFFAADPPQLLRAEEPLVEARDAFVRIDVLPGGERLPASEARRPHRKR